MVTVFHITDLYMKLTVFFKNTTQNAQYHISNVIKSYYQYLKTVSKEKSFLRKEEIMERFINKAFPLGCVFFLRLEQHFLKYIHILSVLLITLFHCFQNRTVRFVFDFALFNKCSCGFKA